MKFKFGDILINHWAGDINPQKVCVYLGKTRKHLYVTDMKGKFWEQMTEGQDDGMYEKVGSILDPNLKPLDDYRSESKWKPADEMEKSKEIKNRRHTL